MKEWLNFLEAKAQTLGSDAIQKWAKPLKVVDFDAGNLYLEAEDPLQLNWFEEHLRPHVKSSLTSRSGRPIRVFVALAGGSKKSRKKVWQPQLNLVPDTLFSTATFASYFPGKINLSSSTLLQEALASQTFNPIYLHGPLGTGKTHLLMAACHLLRARGKTCFYVKADRFTEHLVAAIRAGQMLEMRKTYRASDVLILDDIEAFADRTASQEELFHTFNAFHLAGKQILLSATRLPSHLTGIEPRLTSRFEWGLTLPLHLLAEEDRAAYLTHLLAEKNLHLTPPHHAFCLSLLHTPALLRRAVDILEVRLKQAAPTEPLLTAWLKSLTEEQKQKAITPEAIVKAVASYFDLLPADLQGKSQLHEHTTPRHIAMYLCRKKLHLPFMKISALFSRDHSTVMTSVRLIEKKLAETATTQETLSQIWELIGASNG